MHNEDINTKNIPNITEDTMNNNDQTLPNQFFFSKYLQAKE